MQFTTNKRIEDSLKDNYIRAIKDEDFKKLIVRIKMPEKEVMKNVTKLENTVCELRNCQNCKGIASCKNETVGFVNYPRDYNGKMVFSYVACKYKKQEINQNTNNDTNYILDHVSLKELDTTNKDRYELIRWVTNFVKNYDSTKENKGLYLHGNFGCGKTYILAGLLNEMRKKRYKTKIVYFPELLRNIKNDFEVMNDTIDELCDVDFLLIDDIGAERVTQWGRDEILGTILQYRMNNQKTTFFTSNFNINELESHLSNNGLEKVKASRIIERIKQLTQDMEIISVNMRK